ncbi:hypothetical protein Sste5346_002082 [Sporothrix stenoceras]|uniref:Macro domain-containing protein n=1 Tax=Sporothrix stenoceras TaxID=5173 RepID=A0ABR3ZLC1_9PEZI
MASRNGIDVRTLPTLTDLYESGELSVPETITNSTLKSANGTFQPSAAINNKVVFLRGDLTNLKADAIVNAANRSLLGGGGVDGAIHRAAGPNLLQACIPLNGCATGDAKITPGFRLPAKFVIHTVGPVYDDLDPQDSNRLLASCYSRSLEVAVGNEPERIRTIAFCAISTGIYGFPSVAASAQAVVAVRKFLDSEAGKQIDRVVFVTFEMKDVDAYRKALPIAFPPVPTADETAETGNSVPAGAADEDVAPANPENENEAPAAPSASAADTGDAPAADIPPKVAKEKVDDDQPLANLVNKE